MHHYVHFKRYEDIIASLSKSNKTILQKAVLLWNGSEIKLDETEVEKLPQATQDALTLLLEKSGYTRVN